MPSARSTLIGNLLLLLGFAAGPVSAEEPAVPWQRVIDHAEWQPRDSQGEVVFDGRIWILGGWFDSNSSPPRDVWSSSDGRSWTRITQSAPWTHSDLPMTAVFAGRMWLMGGWRNGRLDDASASNTVWASADGQDWQQVAAAAGWSPRLGAGIAVFQDRLWILGGSEQYYYGDARSLKNDVWSTSDGAKWQQVTAAAPWAPRAYLQAAVLGDRLYVLGGGNYQPDYAAHNDVWSTADGINWREETDSAAWAPRIWFSSVVYRDRLWVLGGWSNNPSRNWGDVWHSTDGKHWIELKTTEAWKARHEHSAFVFQDRLWIAGGMTWPLVNDVWSIHVDPRMLEGERNRGRRSRPPALD